MSVAADRPSSSAGGIGPLVAVGLAMGPAVALGFARFGYALLLPAMRGDLGWSFATAGAMNTANAAGYLVGAMVAAPIAARAGERRALAAGMALTAASLLGSGLSDQVPLLLGLRLLAGVAGAVAFVVGGGLAARGGLGATPGRAGLLLGVYFAGGGLGMMVSGAGVPALIGHLGWRAAWLAMGVASALAMAAAIPAARAVPDAAGEHRASGAGRWRIGSLWPILGAYLLFGAGYIAYMTFIVAFLARRGSGPLEVSLFWVVLGAAAFGSGFLWPPVLGRLRERWGPSLLLVLVAIGAGLPLLSGATLVTFASALLFGISFLAVVAAVTAYARRRLPPRHWTSAIAALTVAFALGQCAGPVLAGALSDGPAGVRAGLLIGVGLLAAGALTALAQRTGGPLRPRPGGG
jgi:predicted MFS family arabinose efflux permease